MLSCLEMSLQVMDVNGYIHSYYLTDSVILVLCLLSNQISSFPHFCPYLVVLPKENDSSQMSNSKPQKSSPQNHRH